MNRTTSLIFITILLIVIELSCAKLSKTRNTLACGNNLLPCGSSCYNKSLYRCFGSRLCSINNRVCGNTCYSVAGYNCNNGGLCPINHPPCGQSCYDPLLYTCSGTSLRQRNNAPITCGSTTCPAGRACCTVFGGSRCYDPNTQSCVDLENATYHAICPKGRIACSLRAGTACFNPNTLYCTFPPGGLDGTICRVGSFNPTTGSGPQCNIPCSGADCTIYPST